MNILASSVAIFATTLFVTSAQADNNVPTRPATQPAPQTNTTQIDAPNPTSPGGRPTVGGQPSAPFNPNQITFPPRNQTAGVVRPRPVLQVQPTARPRVAMQVRPTTVARPRVMMQVQARPMNVAMRPAMSGGRRR
jgi:hypothetical protein